MNHTMTGTITRLLPTRGFGFITDENGDSRMFHARDCAAWGVFEHLREGQGVDFEPKSDGKGQNGLRAVEVRPCSS